MSEKTLSISSQCLTQDSSGMDSSFFDPFDLTLPNFLYPLNLGASRASFHARLIVSASVGGKVAGLGLARRAGSPRTRQKRRVRRVGKFFIASCALFERPQPGSPLIHGYGSSLVSLSQPKISAQIALILSKPIESSSMDRTQC